LRLLLDEQHDRHIAEVLRREGNDAVAVTDGAGLRGKPDRDVLEAGVAEHRAIVTENARDFVLLHRRFIDEGRTHYGIVLTVPRRFTRRKAGRAQFLTALRSLLRAYPSEDGLRDQLIWLGERDA
jgi:predicted nuclease of predicted toxin-antitoxin system